MSTVSVEVLVKEDMQRGTGVRREQENVGDVRTQRGNHKEQS